MGTTYWDKEKKAKAIELVLKRMSGGESLRKILEDRDEKILPSRNTFNKWLLDDKDGIRYQYTHACEERSEFMADEILEIADERNADVKVVDGTAVIDGATPQRSRIQIDARKWLMSKMHPKKYGDRQHIDFEDKTNPLTDEERKLRIKELMSKIKK